MDEAQQSPTTPPDPATIAPTELLRDLLDRGLITREEFDLRARTAQTSAGIDLGGVLAPRGLAPGTPPTSCGTGTGPASPPPPRRLGKYALLREVGSGGMGVVYEALQDGLNRTVAVKVLHLESTLAVERFRREGQALAALQHPNIVHVYEAGEDGGRPYLAMEYVAGPSLEGLLARARQEGRSARLDPRQVATWIAQVADALHHAHLAGLVHRDVKPANILIAPGDVPKVTDFGLAKRLDAESKLTLSGALLGTPYYMAPEQAGGRTSEIDARTDVYALGVVLYQALTGVLPHMAEDVSTLFERIQSQDPVRPRAHNDGLPVDLETIVLLCLEKEPWRRYAAAAALAEDLRRWLAGEPIEARLPSTWYRARRWVRRNKAVSATAATVLVAGLCLAAVSRFLKEKARLDIAEARAEIASTKLYHEADKTLAVGLALRRKGDTSELERGVGEVVSLAEGALAKNPGNVEAHFVLAWALGLMGRWSDAIRSLDEVVRRSPSDPLARYERGRAWTMEYLRLREEAVRLWKASRAASATVGDVPLRTSVLAPDDKDLVAFRPGMAGALNRARQDFALLRPADLERPGLWESAQGHLAFATGRLGDARAAFEAALRLSPERDDARVLLAESLLRLWDVRGLSFDALVQALDQEATQNAGIDALFAVRARARADEAYRRLWEEGAWEEAARLWAQAEEDATRAAALWPTRPEEISCRADLRTWRGEALAWHGSPEARECLWQAVEDADEAVRQVPDGAEPYVCRALARKALADWTRRRGEDPLEGYRAALADFDEAERRSRSDPAIPAGRAAVRLALAGWAADRGEDPEEEIGRALADYDRAEALGGDVAALRLGRAQAFGMLGVWRGRQGADPLPAFRSAIEGLNRALEAEPDRIEALSSLAEVQVRIAFWRRARGEDPTEEVARAVSSYSAALERNARFVPALHGRAEVVLLQADWETGRGQDPRDRLRRAIEDLGKTIEVHPAYARALVNRGLAHTWNGEAMAQAGLDAEAEYRAAVTDFDRALACVPGSADGLSGRAEARAALAAWTAAAGKDASREFAEARADCERISADAHVRATHLVAAALVRARIGEWMAGRGTDPSPEYRAAQEAARRALSLEPASAEGLETLASVTGLLATWAGAQGDDSSALFEEALDACDRALRADPSRVLALGNRGGTWLRYGEWKAALGADPTREFENARDDYARWVDASPRSPAAHRGRGHAHFALGETKEERSQDPTEAYRAAHADFDRLVGLLPGDADALADRAAARLRLGDWTAGTDGDPTRDYEAAAADYARVLEAAPDRRSTHADRGYAFLRLAEWQDAHGVDPSRALDSAIAEYGGAIEIDPGDADAYDARASARKRRGEWAAGHGEAPGPHREGALRDYGEAIRLRPEEWRTRYSRGLLLESLERWDEALADFAAAAEASRDPRPRDAAERVRKRLER